MRGLVLLVASFALANAQQQRQDSVRISFPPTFGQQQQSQGFSQQRPAFSFNSQGSRPTQFTPNQQFSTQSQFGNQQQFGRPTFGNQQSSFDNRRPVGSFNTGFPARGPPRNFAFNQQQQQRPQQNANLFPSRPTQDFQRQNADFIRRQQAIIDAQVAQQQQQQFRPQQRPSQQQNRPFFQQNNNNQFRPAPRPTQPRPTPKPSKKKPEVDPASLNPPTENNPSPTNDQGRRFVAQPELLKCQRRIIHARHGNHGYYFSWLDPNAANKEYDWLDARNYCRQRCMDSVSIETESEDKFVQDNFMKGYRAGQVAHVWTSGRVCDFDGCDRPDLQPIRVKGWFWPATGAPTVLRNNTRNQFAGWSTVGGFPGQGQPDNRQGDENCIAILDPSVYNEIDGLPHWHDVKCTYKKKMICEDNDNLLGFIRQENRGVQVP